MKNLTSAVLSEAEETAIRSFAYNLGTQWGEFVSTALSGFLILVVALRKQTKVVQMSSNSKPITVPPQADRLLTAGDVANRLNISISKAYQLLKGGRFHVYAEKGQPGSGRQTWKPISNKMSADKNGRFSMQIHPSASCK